MATTNPPFKDVHRVAHDVNRKQRDKGNSGPDIVRGIVAMGGLCLMGLSNHASTFPAVVVFFLGLAMFVLGLKGLLFPDGRVW